MQPLFKTCNKFFDPDGSFNEALNQIDINYRYWQERVKESKEKEEEDLLNMSSANSSHGVE